MTKAQLEARLAAGTLTTERVRWAARLGHAAAGKVTGLQPGQDDPLLGCLTGKVLSPRELRRFACDCVARWLPAWERERPDEVARPRAILAGLREQVEAEAADEARLVELGRQAYALRSLEVSDGADLVLTALYCVAMPNPVDAARQAMEDLADGVALLAMDRAGTDDEEVGHAAAEEEYLWQAARLCESLLAPAKAEQAGKRKAGKKKAGKKKAGKKKAGKKKVAKKKAKKPAAKKAKTKASKATRKRPQ